MKIGVIGTFIRDRIFPWRGQETSSIGGIFFTVSYLANLVDENTEIWPVCNLGADFYDEVMARLSGYSNVRFDGMRRVARDNTQVQLHYTAPQERDEITTTPMPAVTFEQIAVLADADAVIVNLITGADVALSALRRFQESSEAMLYLDFHSRALGIDKEGKRYYRRPHDWMDWVDQADVLQLNEMEARTLAGLPAKGERLPLLDFTQHVLHMKPSVCHITLADEGSILGYCRAEGARLAHVPGVDVRDVVDIIGCGDAFEAAYVVSVLSGASELEATAFAHRVAAANCTFMGSSRINEINKLVRHV